MTPEEIIAMAKEAGITFRYMTVDGEVYDYRHVYCSDAKFKDEAACIERFAALVAAKAASRATEACAVLALDKAGTTDYDYSTCINIADAIRARGTKEGV